MAKANNEKAIKKLMDTLDITREEAIDMIKYDNDEIDNETAAELESKAKQLQKEEKGGSKKGSSLDKVKNQKAKKKTDANKEEIMKGLQFFISNSPVFINPQDLTSSKITFKDKDGNYYSVSLTKHKDKPDGYSEE